MALSVKLLVGLAVAGTAALASAAEPPALDCRHRGAALDLRVAPDGLSASFCLKDRESCWTVDLGKRSYAPAPAPPAASDDGSPQVHVPAGFVVTATERPVKVCNAKLECRELAPRATGSIFQVDIEAAGTIALVGVKVDDSSAWEAFDVATGKSLAQFPGTPLTWANTTLFPIGAQLVGEAVCTEYANGGTLGFGRLYSARTGRFVAWVGGKEPVDVAGCHAVRLTGSQRAFTVAQGSCAGAAILVQDVATGAVAKSFCLESKAKGAVYAGAQADVTADTWKAGADLAVLLGSPETAGNVLLVDPKAGQIKQVLRLPGCQ